MKETRKVMVAGNEKNIKAAIRAVLAAETKLKEIKFLDAEELHVRDSLVCIANIESGEVLRLPKEKAYVDFILVKDSKWAFTEKRIYKQYLDSKKPGSNIPAPVFVRQIEGEDGQMKSILVNISYGMASQKHSKKRSSSNKSGKHRYQYVKANIITNSNGEQEEKKARTIKHNMY